MCLRCHCIIITLIQYFNKQLRVALITSYNNTLDENRFISHASPYRLPCSASMKVELALVISPIILSLKKRIIHFEIRMKFYRQS